MMGAIAGYFCSEGLDTSEGSQLLSKMLDKLSARAPKQRGSMTSSHCGLGCIGAKPYRNASSKIAFVLDGHLDDSITTSDLEALGISEQVEHDAVQRFTMNYRDQAEGFLKDVPDTFSLALWDSQQKKLLLAKDHFGTRSLCYAWTPDKKLLLFASEAKAILATGKVASIADAQSILDILSAGYPMDDRTLFRDIKSIRPGTWISINTEGFSSKGRYWSVPYPRLTQTLVPSESDFDIQESLEIYLKESTKNFFDNNKDCRLLLNFDKASINLATVVLSERSQLKSLSLDFHQEQLEELVDTLGLEHAFTSFSDITLSQYMNALDGLELPLVDSTALTLLPIIDLCKRNKCTSIITSAGADSLLFDPQQNLHPYKNIRYGFARFIFNWRHRQVPGLSKHLRSLWTYRKAFTRKYGIEPSNFMNWGALSYVSDKALNRDFPTPMGFDRLPQPWNDTSLNLKHNIHRALMCEQQTYLSGYTLPTWERILGTAGISHNPIYVSPKVAEVTAQWPHSAIGNLKLFDLDSISAKIRKKIKNQSNIECDWPFSVNTPAWVEKALSQEAIEDVGLFNYRVIQNMRSHLSSPGKNSTKKFSLQSLRTILGLQLLWQHFAIEKLQWAV